MISTFAVVCGIGTGCGDDGDGSPHEASDAGLRDAASSVDARVESGSGPNVPLGPVAAALPDGQVVAPWDAYCVATFTRDFTVKSFFDDVLLEIQKGDRYLLAAGSFDERIVYIGEDGATDLRIETSDTPYTSSCRTSDARFSVFADTTVYADLELTMPVCELKAGQLFPAGAYSVTLADDAYEVSFAGLASVCDGTTGGFVHPVHVELEGGGTTDAPFVQIAVPKG
jgi:hypothetical protein